MQSASRNTLSSRLIALLFFITGVAHFVIPDFFIGIVPPFISWKSEAVWLSGVAELLGAVGMLVPHGRVRYWAGWWLIAVLVAVYPANIYMLQKALDSPLSTTAYLTALWVRLPLQPLLIWWIWRVAIRAR